MNFKNINFPLLMGGLILLLILVLAFYGDDIVPMDPYATNQGGISYENGELTKISPLNPPNEINIFGTDVLGRDILSRIIYGTRTTLLLGVLIAFIRFIIALPLGIMAGFGERVSGLIIDFFDKVFSALPGLIISILILNLYFVSKLELRESIIVFSIVLAFVGWGRLAKVIKNRVKDILSKDFIEGEFAIGKSKILIALQNVLPHLTATIIIQIFLEISSSLILIAQLGVFGVYVGKNKVSSQTVSELQLDFTPSYDPEWGSLLGTGKYGIIAGTPWVPFFPAMAFFISILGFNLFGEGLKIEVNKRTSMVITYIRRIPYYLSPKTFIYELRNFNKNRRSIILKTSIIALLIIIALIPPPKSLYKISGEEVFSHVTEISKDKYDGRLVGSKGRDEAAKYIVDKLKANGIEPYYEDGYIREFNTKYSIIEISDSKLMLIDDKGKVLEDFDYKLDYNIKQNYRSQVFFYKDTIGGEILTSTQYENGEYDKDKKYLVIMDKGSFGTEEDWYLFDQISRSDFVEGIVFPMEETNFKSRVNRKSYITMGKTVDSFKEISTYPMVIELKKTIWEEIKSLKGKYLGLKSNANIIEDVTFKNIGGIIRGQSNGGGKSIMISTNYDYLGNEGSTEYKGLIYNGTSLGSILEIGETLSNIKEKPKNDIILMFFDGSKFYRHSGSEMEFKDGYGSFKDIFAICLNDLAAKDSDSLYIDTSLASTNEKENFKYTKYIKKRARELDINIEQQRLVNRIVDIRNIKNGKGYGVLIKSSNDKNDLNYKYYGTPQNDLNLVNRDALERQTQLILDTIIHISY